MINVRRPGIKATGSRLLKAIVHNEDLDLFRVMLVNPKTGGFDP